MRCMTLVESRELIKFPSLWDHLAVLAVYGIGSWVGCALTLGVSQLCLFPVVGKAK